MKNNNLTTITIGLVAAIGWVAPASAAEPDTTTVISLETLVTQTVASNPELQFYRDQIAMAEGRTRAAGRWENPELSVSGGHKHAETRSGEFADEGAAWSVSVAQKFDFAGRPGLRKAIADRDVALAELGLEQFQITLAARIRALGFRLFAAQTRLNQRRQQADRFAALSQVAIQRDPAGVTPRLEARILEATALVQERQAVDANLAMQAILSELNVLRGKSASEPLQIIRPGFRFQSPTNTLDLITSALNWNFEFKARKLELEQQGFRVRLAERGRYPEVTLEPFYMEENAFDHERIVGLGLRLPLPLWNRNRGEVVAADARKRQAQTMVWIARRDLAREIHLAMTEYEARIEEMNRWPADVINRFQQAASEGDQHYRLGALPVGTYITLQQQAMEALESLLKTQARAVDAGQQVYLLTGVNLITLEPLPTQDAP